MFLRAQKNTHSCEINETSFGIGRTWSSRHTENGKIYNFRVSVNTFWNDNAGSLKTKIVCARWHNKDNAIIIFDVSIGSPWVFYHLKSLPLLIDTMYIWTLKGTHYFFLATEIDEGDKK